ncbi:MAG TPA: ABC transporter substrate-binding protein [Xanthobacteraceae bacterium]|jgi:branched-chain amino acid transport system substrate-binding protein|nr:ABC transporter substrate-binding protein [Xanthobacteraceae bacterium]
MLSRRLGLLTFAAGLFAFSSLTFADDTIKVGVTVAQSPPGSVSQGTQVKDGMEVAAKIINDAGGVDGKKIQLIVEDTQGIPEKARAAVEKLITRDQVVAIVGEHQSSAALAGIEVAHRYHIPYINTNGWSDVIREKGYPEVFNPGVFNSRVAIAVADTMKSLGAKNVVAFCENTDYGVGLAKLIGAQIAERTQGINYKYETLDRASKDYLPAILPLKANPPDVIVEILLPPGAYILLNQLNEQGVAPTAKTMIYDASGIADYPDFWQNVGDAAKNMLVFGLYHPKMALPDLGKKVAADYTAKTKSDPNRLLFQAADSLFLVAEAIKAAKSTKADDMIKALEAIKWSGTRGEVSFSNEKSGFKYHQWLDVPYVTFQITKVKQPVADMNLVQDPGKPLDLSRVQKTK